MAYEAIEIQEIESEAVEPLRYMLYEGPASCPPEKLAAVIGSNRSTIGFNNASTDAQTVFGSKGDGAILIATRHHLHAAFMREALTVFDKLPDDERYQDRGLLAEALIEMKREAEARQLLLQGYAYHARTYGEQNPQAVRTRQRVERLDAATRRR